MKQLWPNVNCTQAYLRLAKNDPLGPKGDLLTSKMAAVVRAGFAQGINNFRANNVILVTLLLHIGYMTPTSIE